MANLLMAHGLLEPRVAVIGLLRGGVPVAAPLARTANCRLGALAVRKLGVPVDPEVAFGAVAAYGFRRATHLVPHIHRAALLDFGLGPLAEAERLAALELEALATRFAAHAPALSGRRVVLCDDGLATGATMHAALEVVAPFHPAEIVVAVPVSPAHLVQEFELFADSVFCLHSPEEFGAVGACYEDFSQADEDEVIALLEDRPMP